MDFLKILKSFEEFVYEALIWLLLLPWTLIRIVVRPRRMALYAAQELGDEGEERFDAAISPPLLLILCVAIAHFTDLAIRAQVPDTSGSLASVVLASEQNLLLYRTIAFGVWALAGAVVFLRQSRIAVGRKSLRVPFYEQCYLVAPFALVLSISGSLLQMGDRWAAPGALTMVAGGVWFWIVQVDWIRARTRLPLWHSLAAGTAVLLAGSLVNAAVGYVLSHPDAVAPADPPAETRDAAPGRTDQPPDR